MLSGSGFTKIVFLQVRTDSFWDKMGTLGRKKKVAEVQQVEVEGKHAIDSPGFVLLFYYGRVHAESFKPSFYHKESKRNIYNELCETVIHGTSSFN